MPWGVFRDGDKYCVHKLTEDKGKGEQVACHDSESAAEAQVKALYANYDEEHRKSKSYTAAEREKATTMPDGSYPIDTVADLKRAISSYGRGARKGPARAAAIRRWIKKRARALGAAEMIPENWRSDHADFPPEDFPEMRSAGLAEVEITNGNTFRGYAAVFDVIAHLHDDFTESVARGAFRKAIRDERYNIPFLYDHGGPPLMTTAAGTLRLNEDAKGLEVEGDLPEHHTHVRMLREQVDRGEVAGMSWGFILGPGNSKIEVRGDKLHRDLLGFKRILDVSPTWDPAYDETAADIRRLRYNFLAESLDWPQQFFEAEHQEHEEGADQADAEETEAEEQEEQPSGATEVVAARNRQLDDMELELKREEQRAMISLLNLQLPADLRVKE